MKIIITGASGFLGTYLTEKLRREKHEVTALNSKMADLKHPDSLNKFSSSKFDQIYHLAAWTQAGDFCLRHPGEQWLINQKINTTVLDWWHRSQPEAKLIFMGTSCAYAPEAELTETNYMAGEPIESLYTYAMTKRMLLQGATALSKQFGHEYLCLVPSTLYGPGYHTDGRQMHFIFDLMRKILRAKYYGETVVLWGDGYQQREIIHVEDFVNAILRLESMTSNELYNIGAGEQHTIRYFADVICQIVGYDSNKIEYDTSRYVGAKSKCLDIKKIRAKLPGYSTRTVGDGIRQTLEWFEQANAY